MVDNGKITLRVAPEWTEYGSFAAFQDYLSRIWEGVIRELTLTGVALPGASIVGMTETSLQEEHVLVQIVRSREDGYQEAATTLMERLGGFVVAMVTARGTLQSDDLDEVVQQVWLRVFSTTANETFATAPEFRAWLKSVATTRTIDHFRQQQRRRDRQMSDQMDVSDDVVVEDPRVDALERCLGQLDEIRPDYAAVVRAVTAGTPGEDIAVKLGIRQNTVYSRYNRAKQALKDCIERRLA